MAKSNNQKAKILYLEKMLRETGEHRVISMQKILENLEKQGIRAERKSIYDDVEVLRSFGMDIRYTRERPGGYYLAGESAGEEQPSEEPGLTAEAKEIHETKDIHETSVTGYRKLLEASAGTIKKEIKLLCTGAVQAEVLVLQNQRHTPFLSVHGHVPRVFLPAGLCLFHRLTSD